MKTYWCLLLCSLLCSVLWPVMVCAEDSQGWFGATFGASYEYGELGDSGMGLQNRSMSAEAFEFLPGYRVNAKWLVGLDFSYRVQQQLSSLSAGGGTNLAGRGYVVGLGAKYDFSPKWSLQGAIGFLGRYDFDRKTDQQQDDHLNSPIGFRMKGQYFFREGLPLSVDGIVDYQSWGKFHVAGTDLSNPASQWMIGVGLTYHFGSSERASSESITAPAAESQAGEK